MNSKAQICTVLWDLQKKTKLGKKRAFLRRYGNCKIIFFKKILCTCIEDTNYSVFQVANLPHHPGRLRLLPPPLDSPPPGRGGRLPAGHTRLVLCARVVQVRIIFLFT